MQLSNFPGHSSKNLILKENGQVYKYFSGVDVSTEIWTPETGLLESKSPILERGILAYGIGVWLVDDGYCAKSFQ